LNIQKLSKKDIDDIHRLDERFGTPWSNELYIERLSMYPELGYGAYHHGKLIGFVLAKRLPSGDLVISRIVVDKKFEGKGIATKLMRRIDTKRKRNIHSTVRIGNERSINLHKRSGFRTLSDNFYTFKDGEKGLKFIKG